MRPFSRSRSVGRGRQLKWPHLKQIGNLETVRAKRTRAAGMSRAARTLRSDVVRRAEARRLAHRDVDKSYASHRLN
jgi:hypothetical protein